MLKSDLLELCKERGIRVKSNTKKADIIQLLIDARKVTKVPPKKAPPKDFRNAPSKPKTVPGPAPTEPKGVDLARRWKNGPKILVIGDFWSLDKTQHTWLGDGPTDLSSKDLREGLAKNHFDEIIVRRPGFISGNVSSMKALVDSVKLAGRVLCASDLTDGSDFALREFLTSTGSFNVTVGSLGTIKIDGVPFRAYVKRREGMDLVNLYTKFFTYPQGTSPKVAPSPVVVSPRPKKDESSDSEGEPESPISYQRVSVELPYSGSVSKLGITLKEFKKEIESDKFISDFLSSVKKFMEYKKSFYTKKLEETKDEFAKIDVKVRKLQAMKTRDSQIQEMYPMYSQYAGFIFQLQEIIGVVAVKEKSLTVVSLRKSLTRAINHTKKGFASIIGREDIKDQIASILYSFSKSHKTLINAFGNICLMGHAGVGKTAIAKVLGYVYSKSGILATNIVKIVSRCDLVRGYIGHTAPATRALLFETLEGVLFIDEAYQLTPKDAGRDFGPEAMTEIVNFLDKYIGMSVVMVAGYKDKMMEEFFPSNEGLSRRFPYMLELSDYSDKELANILIRNINSKRDQKLDSETCNYLYSMVCDLREEYESIFNNQAGDMLNLGTAIAKAIHSSFRKRWKEGNLENNKDILLSGIREYASLKGIKWKEKKEEAESEDEEEDEEESEDEEDDEVEDTEEEE